MCETSSKIWLFIFNFIFFLGGVALCAYGGYTLAFHKNLPDVDAGKSVEDILAVGIVFVIVGAAIVLVTFLGCCGAISENGCILLTFAIIVTMIMAAQAGVGIYGVVQKEKLPKILMQHVRNAWNHKTHKSITDFFQKEFECCGFHQYTEYVNHVPNIDSVLAFDFPLTCCEHYDNDQNHICTEQNVYQKGCKESFIAFLKSNINIIIGLAIGLCIFEIIGIVLSCILYSKINRRHRVY